MNGSHLGACRAACRQGVLHPLFMWQIRWGMRAKMRSSICVTLRTGSFRLFQGPMCLPCRCRVAGRLSLMRCAALAARHSTTNRESFPCHTLFESFDLDSVEPERHSTKNKQSFPCHLLFESLGLDPGHSRNCSLSTSKFVSFLIRFPCIFLVLVYSRLRLRGPPALTATFIMNCA